MENNYGILLILLFPVIGGLIGFYLGKKDKGTRNDWIDIVMIVQLVMLVYLAYVTIGKGGEAALVLGDFLGIGLSFTMDTVRVLLSILVTVVFGIITQFMKESMKKEPGSNRFYFLFLCLYGMILGACMSNNLFNFFMFTTLALLVAYPLIMHRRDEAALKNANIYISFLIAGVVLILTGVTILFGYLGSVSYGGMYSSVMSRGGNSVILLGGLLMFAGFAILAGMFPVQFMVTRGCSYGLIEISAVLSSVVSKLGIYGMLILAVDLFVENTLYGKILLVGGILTIIWGILVTLTSTDIRKILMGLDIAVNGFNMLGVSFILLSSSFNAYAVRGSVYMLFMSALSLMVLYMVALEQVRKIKTYEIKGLIASGKGNKLLCAACLLACASLGGVPGTAGFLSYSMIFKTIFTNLGWKWLMVVYIILWAFFMTAVVRVFMKLFVSKKDETIRILATEEELQTGEETIDEEEEKKNPYLWAELLLLLTGLAQLAVGILPKLTVEKVVPAFTEFLHGKTLADAAPYYSTAALAAYGIAVVLCILLYMNLVHGILLRAIKNKKNKKLQEKIQ